VFLERKALGAKIEKTRLIQAGLIAVSLETGRYQEALALLKNLPPSWRDNKGRHMEYDAQYGMALSGMGLLGEASREFLKAVATVEDIRRGVAEKNSFFAGGGYISRLTPHRALAAVLAKMAVAGEKMDAAFLPYGQNPASAAFYFSEMTKARTRLEAMSAAAQKSQEEKIPPDLRDKERSILDRLAAVDRQWEAAYKKGEDAVSRLEAGRQSLRDALDRLIKELRRKYPEYAALHYPKPSPPEDLPLKADEVLLEYAIGENTCFLFVVRKGGVDRLVKIPVSRQQLEKAVAAFVAPMNSNEYEQFSIQAGKALYDLLFSEAARDIGQNEHIIIVPDGVLGRLPFEALVTSAGRNYRDTRYAGDTWTITYAQSATTLALMRMRMISSGKGSSIPLCRKQKLKLEKLQTCSVWTQPTGSRNSEPRRYPVSAWHRINPGGGSDRRRDKMQYLRRDEVPATPCKLRRTGRRPLRIRFSVAAGGVVEHQPAFARHCA
jgi:hypothetical protein